LYPFFFFNFPSAKTTDCFREDFSFVSSMTLTVFALHSLCLAFWSLFAFHNFYTLPYILAKSNVLISYMTLYTTWKLL
jgi:hypothetical protein